MGKAIISGGGRATKPSTLPDPGLALNDYTWEEIRAISDAGVAADYFAVGDTKAVAVNGTVGTLAVNKTLYAFILGINHNGENGIHFGCFKTAASDGVDVCLVDSRYGSAYSTAGNFTMNSSSSNSGGWASCKMRTVVLGSDSDPLNPTANTLLSALPAELRAVLKPMTVYTDNTGGSGDTASKVTATTDYLPLLAEFEIFGSRKYANSAEQNYQKRYDYYAAGNSKQKYKHSSTSTAANWWSRSASYSNTQNFSNVTSGAVGHGDARYSSGVAPAFAV